MIPEMSIDLKELYMLIGEREVIRYKLQLLIDEQQKQITEMSEVITKLRGENDGGLGKPTHHDAV